MHPIYKGAPVSGTTTKKTFGVNGLAVQFNAASTAGFIVKQMGTNTFFVSDNTTTNGKLNKWKVKLATTMPLTDGFFTMALPVGAAPSGATFTPHYTLDTAVLSAPGTGYTVGDTLALTGAGGATLTVATITGGLGTGPVGTVTIAGSGSTLSVSSTTGIAVTGGTGTGATFNLKYKVASIDASGGTGYFVGDVLVFTGFTNTTLPTATVATVSSGHATGVTVATPGSGITVAGTIAVPTSVAEHVSRIWDSKIRTVEGSDYKWSLRTSVNGSIALPVFS